MKLNFLLFILACYALMGCQEQPVAKFSYEMLDDGKVRFTDQSQNAESLQWDFGDGTYDATPSPLHHFERNGKYNIRLTATNASGDHSSTVTVDIDNVEQGRYLFWTDKSKYLPIEIYIEGALHSNVRKSFSMVPECWTPGAVTVEVPAGNYRFYAKGKNGSEWSEMDLTFEKGWCKSLKLN